MGLFSSKIPNVKSECSLKRFDLKRYMGHWYEIARFDNWFERGLERTTATYTLEPGGKIKVVNTGRTESGKWKHSTGKARFVDPLGCPGELEVSFFGPFYSTYNVIDLGKEYEYAVVAGKSKRYLWILSRDAKMSREKLTPILHRLREWGYDLTKLKFIDQG